MSDTDPAFSRCRLLVFHHSCTIDWTKGKNVTLKTIKKKQKHKGRGTVRTVTKTVPNDSFFNFFTPPEGKDDVARILNIPGSHLYRLCVCYSRVVELT